MAFIREYSSAGDPFSLRRPKWMKKLKPGRAVASAIKRVVPTVASFIPGAGGIIGRVASSIGGRAASAPVAVIEAPPMTTLPVIASRSPLAARLAEIAQRYGFPEETAFDFARSYGVDVGDPDTDEAGGGMSAYMGDADDLGLTWAGDPAPKPARKRKTAGSGGRVKAQKKKAKRQERSARKVGSAIAGAIGTGARAVGQALPGLVQAFTTGGPKGAMAHMAMGGGGAEAEMAAVLGVKPPKFPGSGAFRMGGRRRTMNPANVRALRRSIRRVEGFQTLVKRIHKAFPALRGPTTQRSSPRRARGHRAGCGCAVCRRAA